MKILEKAVIIGIICLPLFAFANLYIGVMFAPLLGGDDYVNSYFMPLYLAVNVLSTLVVSCTYIIVKKINLLLDEVKNGK